ncbi:ATP-binding protein [Saccharospirillum sp. MSK14-1]|uniref:hybrid sensor histidine kinase/response regulator n=1 Tax=Saccharospirillum sp. MSK14-1 TaxID=1897632 RepID=UPI001304DDF7|nr:ATP-binding protein [Saccharospirillum sp. MSK14-1]
MLPSTLRADVQTPDTRSYWLSVPADWQAQPLDAQTLRSYQTDLTIRWDGGVDWHLMTLQSDQPIHTVLDFRNSSVIGRYRHWIFNDNDELVAEYEGGIQSETRNPIFLRHGQVMELPAGRYQVVTRLDSPFYIGEPEPHLFPFNGYMQSIKIGNAITMAGMGIFFSMGIYYVVLGFSRRRMGDVFYAIFIWGNFVYNGAALLVFSDLFQIQNFYLISIPIVAASNPAYIAFVMVLLNINRYTSRILYHIGQGIIALFVVFWIIALLQPNWSLELARYGVGLFALYGISAGVTRLIQGNRTSRYYLVANIAFFIPGLMSIAVSTWPYAETLFVEHVGLFAVAIEVILLSLVISHQVGMVYREKEAGLFATQEALLAANQALETKERFLANVSHELRTPLNAIQGSVELIDQYSLPTRVQRHIQAIHTSSNFLLYLINDILDLAKLNANQLGLVHEEFDLDVALDELGGLYSNSFNRDRVRLSIDVDTQVPRNLIGDENRIKQVLANLLSNAFKFTEQGEIRLSIRPVDNQHLEFHVSDTGIGIDADKLQSVFSAFTQADASIARRYGGTGLGLHIASKLVNLMGSDLGANSVPGQGSDFYFRLPDVGPFSTPQTQTKPLGLIYQSDELAQLIQQDLTRFGIAPSVQLNMTQLPDTFPDNQLWLIIAEDFDPLLHERLSDTGAAVKWYLRNASGSDHNNDSLDIELLPYARMGLAHLLEAPTAIEPPEQINRLLSQMQIVAVDDNVVNLKVLMGMLRRLNVDCAGFERPEEAIRYIGSNVPDVVLMDVQMPIIDGLEATRHLRQQGFRNPVIAFTANASDHDLDNCRSAGMNDVLVKPIKLEELKRMLLKWSDSLSKR